MLENDAIVVIKAAEGLQVSCLFCTASTKMRHIFLFFSAPTAQVSNVKFERISNNRAALVSWTPLTLHQARGFPVYFVAYQPTGQAAGAESSVINTTDSKVVIEDLDSTTEYTFTLDVGTAGGKSALAAGN